MIKCFFVEQTNMAAMYLRRYRHKESEKCPGQMSYHNAWNYIQDVPITWKKDEETEYTFWSPPEKYTIDHDDPRWPTHCSCGYQFQEEDEWQFFHDKIVSDGKDIWPFREVPVGAMYYSDWLPQNMYWDNKEDQHLLVKTPGGEWNIDSRASNCTMPDDRLHRCWVRHGTPPEITVDKNGFTCAAGAGSIICGDYHGFLQNGHLT